MEPTWRLVTLEPAISSAQTDQTQMERLHLVVPAGIQATYQPAQRDWLLSLRDFIGIAQSRQ